MNQTHTSRAIYHTDLPLYHPRSLGEAEVQLCSPPNGDYPLEASSLSSYQPSAPKHGPWPP